MIKPPTIGATLLCVIIALIAMSLIAALFLLPRDDNGKTLIAEWEQLGHDYQQGKITREEYSRRAEGLTERSKNILPKTCNRKWHTKPCPQSQRKSDKK